MAVTRVIERVDLRHRNDDAGGYYERRYVVESNDPNESPVAIRNAEVDGQRIPRRGEPCPWDPAAKVQSVEVTDLENSPTMWDVTVEYTTTGADFGGGDNPLNRKPEIQGFTYKSHEPITLEPWHRELENPDDPRTVEGNPLYGKDFRQTSNGLIRRPYCNVNGEPFNPPAEREVSRLGIRIVRNQAMFGTRGYYPFHIDTMRIYVNTVNSDTLWILNQPHAPLTAYMDDIDFTFIDDGGFLYWRVSYTLLFREETWTQELANVGYAYRVPIAFSNPPAPYDPPILRRMKDAEGQDTSEPQFLKWNGLQNRMIRQGEYEERFGYIRFHPYRELPFGLLGLPRSVEELAGLRVRL